MMQRKKVMKSENEWREILSPEEYHVLREKGTEPPYTGKYYSFKKRGTYFCIACGAPLFSSEDKYDSGTGWPSFAKPFDGGAVEERLDKRHGVVRTEVVCSRCEGHLGHLFSDGPEPSKMRYCINSLSLEFKSVSHLKPLIPPRI